MNKEIKRILDYLIDEKAYLHYGIRREKFIELEGKEVQTLLDYMTNLQQKYEISQKDIQSLKNNYNDLVKISENKITNLQQENEELNRMCELYSKSLYNAELTDYKSRCKKAIEELTYMSTDAYSDNYDIRDKHYNLLINILNGSDDK